MDKHLSEITRLLQQHENGLSILEVTKLCNLNRNSAARYLDVLKAQGVAQERIIGPAKLYTYSGLLPYESQVDLFKKAMDAASCGITLADATKKDQPLIYVNDAFLKMTGYSREEVLGKNCRFLQGNDRDQKARQTIRRALTKNEPVTVQINNYKKTGEMFLNELHIAPIRNGKDVTHFVGVQTVISTRPTNSSQ